MGDFMSSLMVQSFSSVTFPAQHPTASAFTEATPWRRILAVEPDLTVLYAKSRLLAQANYCVTRASSDREIFNLRGTQAVAVAILSDRLGQRLLGAVAETIRSQWPRTRILILGQVPNALEDYLYDEHICRFPKSQQVLDELESLYKGMWDRRSNSIDWRAKKAGPMLCPAANI